MNQSNLYPNSSKAKILVNWATKRVSHTYAALGSPEYKLLIDAGFEKIGDMKGNGNQLYWDAAFFDPQVKYLAEPKTIPPTPSWAQDLEDLAKDSGWDEEDRDPQDEDYDEDREEDWDSDDDDD